MLGSKTKIGLISSTVVLCGAAATLVVRSAAGSESGQATAPTAVTTADAKNRMDPSRVDYGRLDGRVVKLMQQPDMVGLAVATIERGHVRFMRGYGETLAGSGSAVTPDTVFRWASVSKGVAATLVAKLDEDGRLSLAAPIVSVGTSLRLAGNMSGVTVADLLSHRLGLPRNAWDDRLEAGDDPTVLRSQLSTITPLCLPGTCYSYQNVAFDTASEIVEQVTRQSYAKTARETLFAPLGMTNTSIGRAGLEGSASWARPHRPNRRTVEVKDPYYHVPAAGGVNSSIRNLVRWMSAQMGGAPGVLSPAVLETLHRPRVATPPHGRRGPMDRALANASYGLGWRSFDYAGHRLVGHRGAVDGYGSLILFDPADRSGIVMLWNSSRSTPARLQLEFFDMLYGLPKTDWLALGEDQNARALDRGRQ
ncbi:serine hydrolase [Sphingomonas bacterium]|uniref:serine hydrolase domain-containing protein n=1 Tax=Sphingomonas bacterium TaxID=1895847 RepID=UPI0026205CEF|nr:serine hydrolase domain-containing protein [Sphingomonas bacterium]